MPNAIALEQVPVGSVLIRPKASGLVRHRGIYLGNGQVFENTPVSGERITPFDMFSQGQPVTVEKVASLSIQELYRRVTAAINAHRPYNLFTNNCDHAVSRITDGEAQSPQLVGWGVAALIAFALLP